MFIAIQSTYNNLELGIYNGQTCVDWATINKIDASAKLIPVLNELLIEKNLSLKDIDFIVANKGPAPFTTLRVVLATVNGIALATQIPLVGVDALKTYMEYLKEKYINKNILIIFNAFSGDVYFGLKNNSTYEFGCINFDLLLEKIRDIKNLEIFGNGIEAFGDKLKNFNLNLSEQYPSLDIIAHAGLAAFKNKEAVLKIEPIYLKQAVKS